MFCLTFFDDGSQIYATSPTALLSLRAYQLIAYFFVNFISVSVFDTRGLRLGLLLGSVLTSLGFSLLCLLNEGILWGVAGHMIVALAWPFLWNPVTLVTSLAASNSSENGRVKYTLCGTSARAIGTFIGLLLP